jgi:hypothetical protein
MTRTSAPSSALPRRFSIPGRAFQGQTLPKESSLDKFAYEKKIVERFGGQQELGLVVPTPATASPQPSGQSPTAAS